MVRFNRLGRCLNLTENSAPYSNFTKALWANGQPSIEMIEFDYSKNGFEDVITLLAVLYRFEKPNIVTTSEKYMTTITINDEKVEIDMDIWTCSIAFESTQLRDEVLTGLQL